MASQSLQPFDYTGYMKYIIQNKLVSGIDLKQTEDLGFLMWWSMLMHFDLLISYANVLE